MDNTKAAGSSPAQPLLERLRTRAAIRRKIPRGEPDRIADLLEEAANEIERLTPVNYNDGQAPGNGY